MPTSLSTPPTSPLSLTTPTAPSPVTWVICLCADWCGVCRDYHAIFTQVAQSFQAAQPAVRFAWVDVEDHADLVGDLDVETFPTLLVASGQSVQFLGPLTPQAHVLTRLIDALTTSALAPDAIQPVPKGSAVAQAVALQSAFWITAGR